MSGESKLSISLVPLNFIYRVRTQRCRLLLLMVIIKDDSFAYAPVCKRANFKRAHILCKATIHGRSGANKKCQKSYLFNKKSIALAQTLKKLKRNLEKNRSKCEPILTTFYNKTFLQNWLY